MVEMVTVNELLPATLRLTSLMMGFVEANPQKLAGKAENPHSADLS